MRYQLRTLTAFFALALAVSCAGEDGTGTAEEQPSVAEGAVEAEAAAHPGAVEHAAMLQSELALSDEQASRVEAIFATPDLTWDARGEQIRALLTPDQTVRFEALLASHGCGGGECSGHDGDSCSHGESCQGCQGSAACGQECGHHSEQYGQGDFDASAHATRLQDALGLTDEVTAQIEAIFATPDLEREVRIERINAVLTPEQAARLNALHAQHHHPRWNADPAAHAAHLANELGLTDEQTAQVEAVLADDTVSFGERFEQIDALLTPEQATQLDALLAQHQRGWRHPEPTSQER